MDLGLTDRVLRRHRREPRARLRDRGGASSPTGRGSSWPPGRRTPSRRPRPGWAVRGSAVGVVADLADPAVPGQLVEAALETFGRSGRGPAQRRRAAGRRRLHRDGRRLAGGLRERLPRAPCGRRAQLVGHLGEGGSLVLVLSSSVALPDPRAGDLERAAPGTRHGRQDPGRRARSARHQGQRPAARAASSTERIQQLDSTRGPGAAEAAQAGDPAAARRRAGRVRPGRRLPALARGVVHHRHDARRRRRAVRASGRGVGVTRPVRSAAGRSPGRRTGCGRARRRGRRRRAARRGARARRSAAVLDDEDLVGVAHRRQPVRDDERRAAVQSAGQRPLHRGLGLGVEVRGRLVEDDDVGRLEQQPGDGQPLLLAAGQPVAAVADDRVEAVGQRRDEVPDLGGAAARRRARRRSRPAGRRAGWCGSSRGTCARPG